MQEKRRGKRGKEGGHPWQEWWVRETQDDSSTTQSSGEKQRERKSERIIQQPLTTIRFNLFQSHTRALKGRERGETQERVTA